MQMLFGATDDAMSKIERFCLGFLLIKKHGRGLGISVFRVNSKSTESLRNLRSEKNNDLVKNR